MSGDGVGFGAWYDEKQGDTGDLWHRTLIDPGLFDQLGELPRGTRILEVGCGNGYLARRLARAGGKVTGIDANRELLDRAQERERAEPLGIVYQLGDAASMPTLSTGAFDVAVANMSLMDIEDAAGAIAEVGRVLRPGGRFVATLSHPCFDVDTRSAWDVETSNAGPTIFRKVTDYRRPHSAVFEWPSEGGPTRRTTGYHRPLSWYAHELRRSGFVIVDLGEPAPTAEFVGRRTSKEWLDQIPLHLVIDALRVGNLMEPGAESPA